MDFFNWILYPTFSFKNAYKILSEQNVMNVLKCRTLAELHVYEYTTSASRCNGERSFNRHQISSDLVNFWQTFIDTCS